MTRSLLPSRPIAAALAVACLLLVPGVGLLVPGSGPAPALGQEASGRTGTTGGDGDAREPFVASPYLSVDHPAAPVIDRWIARGWIDGLSPVTRPWRRADVRRALRRMPADELSASDARWRERLLEELTPASDEAGGPPRRLRGDASGPLDPAPFLRGRLSAGGAYRSQLHRDPLRPELDGPFSEAKLLERVSLEADGRAGPVVADVRVVRDGHFTEDPQFPDGRVVPDRRLPPFDEGKLRVDEAYLGLQSRYARMTFGRTYRNWGAAGQPGLLRSDYAYSWDELAYRVGTDRFSLSGTVTAPGDFARDTTRWITSHRLEARPWPDLVVTLTEAAIHGGPSQPLDFTFVNPLGIWHLSRRDAEGPPTNLVGELGVWWRVTPGLVLDGALLADATNAPEGSDDSCCQMGGTLGVQLPALAPATSLRLRATALQSLVYRTRLPWEEWSVRGLGIGRDKADLYLFTAEGVWSGRPGLVLRPRIDLQLRGEASEFHGRLRPPTEQLPDFPRILSGRTETTLRAALSGRWTSVSTGPFELELGWDLGVNLIEAYRHEAGDDRSAFVGVVELSASTPWLQLPLE